MKEIRAKSLLLTSYLEALILNKYGQQNEQQENGKVKEKVKENDQDGEDWKHVHVDIISPSNPSQRGAQLSLSFSVPICHVFEELAKRGVVVSHLYDQSVSILTCV